MDRCKSAAEALTYNDGSNTYGGHFVTITDSDEQEFVAGLISQVDYDCWIGGNQDSQDPGSEPTGGWKWVTGESWSYTNWDTGEPSDGGDDEIDNQENYALMKTSGYWNDLANVLFFTGGYIVEYDILLQNEETGDNNTVEIESTTVSKPWVRDHEMTCYQVWVNKDNNFEFVFWWEYANNNWVKIYDMAGNEVFSIDMLYGSANFITGLPDGMYTVKTFHNGFETPIQEFLIGKP